MQSTTPVDRRVFDAMLPYFMEEFGNPHSAEHDFGHRAAAAIEEAAGRLASVIGARASDVIFTSGATESNNLALRGLLQSAIEAALNYLREVAPLILDGDLNSNVHSELERFEVSLSAVQTHLCKDIEAVIAEVGSLKDPDTFGTTGLTHALRVRQELFEDLVTQWKYCLAARFMACRLLVCFPQSLNVAVRRRESLTEVSGMIEGDDGFITRFNAEVERRKESFKAMTDSTATVAANKERLNLWDQARRPALAAIEHVSFNSLDRLVLDTKQPIEILLEIKEGQLLRAFVA